MSCVLPDSTRISITFFYHCICCISWTIFFSSWTYPIVENSWDGIFEANFARMYVFCCKQIMSCFLRMVGVCLFPMGPRTQDLSPTVSAVWEMGETSPQRGNFKGSNWSPSLSLSLVVQVSIASSSSSPICPHFKNALFLLYTKSQYCHGLWIEISNGPN